MRKKQVFRTVAEHLLKQKIRSVYKDECLYRAPQGLSCAIGCLISDEHYSEDLEGNQVDLPEVREAVSKSLGQPVTARDVGMLQDLQDLHDFGTVESWERRLDELAGEYFESKLMHILES